MKQLNSTILLTILFCMFGAKAQAYDIAVENADGVTIYYNYINDGAELEVTYKNDNYRSYSGSVLIPEDVTYMNRQRKVTSIGESAFWGCTGLTSITIPNSVTCIGDGAFSNCIGLTSITIPNNVTVIDSYAFYYCSGLTSISIPNSVTSIGYYVLYNTGWYKNQSDGLLYLDKWLLGYKGEKPKASITIIEGTKGIAKEVFWDCADLTSISIPNSVTSIGDHAFGNCTGLTSITIPNSVASIGGSAFHSCSSLTSIMIPNSVTSIGGDAFAACTSLTSISVDSGNPKYDSRDNSNSIIDTKNNTLIVGCKNTTIPNSVTCIGDGAFNECIDLSSITIPNSVTNIEHFAFAGCSSLISITIPNSVTNIGNQVFYGCNSLISITIPNSVTSIGHGVFSGCRSLTSVTIPNSVTSIGLSTFEGCRGLTSITIPNSVINIEDRAFYSCSSLNSITIPNSVKSIGNYAFAGCKLLEIVSKNENPFGISSDTFSNYTFNNATVFVPIGTISKYKTTEGWKNFNKIVAIDGDTPETSKCSLPKIDYQNGKLSFSCDTEGVDFISEITDTDIKKNYTKDVDLTVTYIISVYATKSGFENSDVATAMLCWIDADPHTEGITNGVAYVRALPVLIQSNGNVLNISGAPEGEEINVYNLSGQIVGSAKTVSNSTNVVTSLQAGEVGIVKIGSRAVKVIVK